MLAFLLSGDGQAEEPQTTRAQIPLLLSQLLITTAYQIDIAEETDSALDITVFMGAQIVQIDTATETDTAQNITVSHPPGTIFVPVDLAEETGSAFDVTPISSPSGTYPGTYPGPTTYPWSGAYYQLDIAEETSEAFDITPAYTRLFPVAERTGITLSPVSVEAEEDELVPVTPT